MTDPEVEARKLLTVYGPADAWLHAVRKFIDAHLRNDVHASSHWNIVFRHLNTVAPRPAAGNLDVNQSARFLISERGIFDAARYAMQQAEEADGDMWRRVYWLRIADAVNALSQNYGARHP